MCRAILSVIVCCSSWPAAAQAQVPASLARQFDTVIAPLLARRCLVCHEGARPKGGLDLATRQGAFRGGKSGVVLVAGSSQGSVLWEHVQSGQMPPKKPLPEPEKAILKTWIAAGAVWGTDPIDPFGFTTDSRAGYDWWSLQPVIRPPLPAIKNAAWPANPLDHFVLAALEANKLIPSPAADRRTLLRRVTFDLVGLPPSPSELEAFLKDDRPDAYARLIERLLASPQYGERWARHWLDVVRFGESNGFEHDELRKNAWPYRDWVIGALNQDLPYDEFARLQLAGDVLKPDDPAGIIPTGFLVAGGYDSVGQVQQSSAMRAVVRQDELEDIVGTVGQTFLGLTVHCARCHDHKFDPVRQSEYYRLTAALAGVRHGQRDITAPAMRPDRERRQAEAKARLATLTNELDALERPVRTRIAVERKAQPADTSGPRPLARWDFTRGGRDEIGNLDVILHGKARLTSEGLQVPGAPGYAASPPLARDLKARTLAVWVRLANLAQRGGAALSVQTLDGSIFDAIVFGERDPGQWLAGSNGYVRTRSFQGPEETTQEPVHVAIVYQEDGIVTGFRNGRQYGRAFAPPGPVTFAAGKAQFLFGLRHGPAGGNKHLAGTILKAEVYDRALSPQEVAAVAGTGHGYVAEEDLVARLSPAAVAQRQKLLEDIKHWRAVAEAAAAPVLAYACAPKAPEVAHVLLRGEPGQKGPVVSAGGVAALKGIKADFGVPADASDAERRRALAAWITAPANPLFARVLVNRLWHYHFGAGLVDTPSDFGFNGARPSHPALLDWLAAEFRESSWSIKHMHRLIVMSQAYRQQSRFRTDAAKLDAGNRLLWRKSPMRLEAEAVRDAILHVAGKLNPEVGGPGYQDFKLVVRGATHYYQPLDVDDPEHNRRSIYRTWARSGRSSLLDNLDCPDPSTVTPKRTLTTTPLQALAMLNNAFVLRMAEHFATRLTQAAGPDLDRQVTLAYELAYGRRPDQAERIQAHSAVVQHGLSVLCRALFNSNEFMYVD